MDDRAAVGGRQRVLLSPAVAACYRGKAPYYQRVLQKPLRVKVGSGQGKINLLKSGLILNRTVMK